MRLHCKILLKKYYWNRPPRLTGWIHPCFSPFWKWILHRTGCLANRLRHKYDERFVTKDLNYELQLVSTVKCESSKARQKVWFQRSPNFKQMCSKIGLSKWGFRLISRFFFYYRNRWSSSGPDNFRLKRVGLLTVGLISGDYCNYRW